MDCIKNMRIMRNYERYKEDSKYLLAQHEGYEEDCGLRCCLPCLCCDFFTGLIFLNNKSQKESAQYCYVKFYP